VSVPARKRFWVPVLVAVVLAAGFEGYGAYTRSRPVEYARGGELFAPTATPTGTSSSASPAPVVASSSPTAGASATPTRTPVPEVTHEAVVPEDQAVTAPSAPAAAAVVTVPAVGTYPLRVEGSEKVQFGPVSFCNQTLPTSTNLVVQKAAGESATSYDFDVPFFPGKTGQHDERHLYRFTQDAVFLDYEIATVTCQGVRQSSETSYAPAQPRVRLPLKLGAGWHYQGGGSSRTEDATFRVLRTESLTIGGRQVLTYVIGTTTSFTGDESGTRDQTWWYAPSWSMPVKWHEKQTGKRSGASYSGDVTVTVLAHP
jgi:hypothetical protein